MSKLIDVHMLLINGNFKKGMINKKRKMEKCLIERIDKHCRKEWFEIVILTTMCGCFLTIIITR